MSPRLCERRLPDLPAHVSLPRYDRTRLRTGIVHLGTGAFHRAHQAWYTEQVLNRGGGDWGIVGASLRSPDIRDRLAPQDGLYTLVERNGDHRRYQLIGAVCGVLVAAESPRALVEQLAHPDIRVVTLTVTEKGYHYDPGTRGLKFDDPAVRRDLESFPAAPVTALGYLAAALGQRRQDGAPGLTLLSCDNLPHNGRVLQKVLTDFVGAAEPTLLPWIEDQVTFPSSMVDRIVPASTEADLAFLEQVLGVRDEAAVFTEPFSQWVIESKFARGAPDWQSVGALLTDDVMPFETMKLRLLNGSHSLIAYLGYLAGYDYVHQAMADPTLGALVEQYMDRQAQPTLQVPSGFDLDRYKRQLRHRFLNAALNHRTYQIAQDGSQKIPQRWLAAATELARMGRSTEILALAVAGWIRYLVGKREDGERFTVDDPLAAVLKRSMTADDPVRAVMGVTSVFGDLADSHPDFVTKVSDFYQQLVLQGILKTAAKLLESRSAPGDWGRHS